MQPICQVFKGIPLSELPSLFESLRIQSRTYPKGALLLAQGEKNEYIRILKRGSAHAVRYTADGREIDYAALKSGDLFGDVMVFSSAQISPVNVYADCICSVEMFSVRVLLESKHQYTHLILKNLAEEIAVKFFALQRRVHYITQQTLRDKILTFLYDCRENAGSESFEIPFDRKALASFLCCDRSSLCRELSCLQKEGVISYRKNIFCILQVQ